MQIMDSWLTICAYSGMYVPKRLAPDARGSAADLYCPQIFDYMNVQSIHNATFANALPDNYLAIARDLANWHEYNVFSDDSFDGIGNSTL